MTAPRRRLGRISLGLLGCMLVGGLSAPSESRAQEARAAYGFVSANLNQRGGPGTRFPSLGVIPARTQVLINGCLADLSWCEGSFGDTRGWMSGQYLQLYDYGRRTWVSVADYNRSTRLATYTFDLERYWAAHYRNRPFYPERASWVAPPRSPQIDNAVFYRELSPYGRWVSLDGRYVWMPDVRPGWRPYTEGRWEYTERYGWTWVSNEPFGWATYHYGRWAYSNRLGWVWVPGTQWAPAWVAWRETEDKVAWAPLPPDAGSGFRLGEGFDEIPSYYWQVIPSASFLRPNLAEVVLRDDDRDRRPWLDRSRPVGNSTVVNNVVVNNVINIDYVEERTRERVVPREVVITNRQADQAVAPGADATAQEVVRIYQPPVVEAPATDSPPAVLPAEVAAGQSQTVGQAGDEPATDDRQPDPAMTEAQAQPTEAPPLAAEEVTPTEAAPVETPVTPEDAAPPAQAEEPGTPPTAEEAAPPATEPPAAAETLPPEGAEPAPPPADAAAPPSPESVPPATEEPPSATEEATPPPAAEEPQVAPPPPAEEAVPVPEAAPPPPPPAEEAVPVPEAAPPPPPPAEEAVPVPEAAPPPPPAEEAVPVPEAAPPPPPPAEEAVPVPEAAPPPPPPAEEAVPVPEAAPPPPPPAEEAVPVPEAAPPPPPPAEEAVPVPEAAPPPPPPAEEAVPVPEAAPPPPPQAEDPPPPPPVEEAAPQPEAAPPPPPPEEEAAPSAAEEQGAACPEGMRQNRQGECVPRRNQ